MQQQFELMMNANRDEKREQAARQAELVALLVAQQQLFAAQQQSVVALQEQVRMLTEKMSPEPSAPPGNLSGTAPPGLAPQAEDQSGSSNGANGAATGPSVDLPVASPVGPHVPSSATQVPSPNGLSMKSEKRSKVFVRFGDDESEVEDFEPYAGDEDPHIMDDRSPVSGERHRENSFNDYDEAVGGVAVYNEAYDGVGFSDHGARGSAGHSGHRSSECHVQVLSEIDLGFIRWRDKSLDGDGLNDTLSNANVFSMRSYKAQEECVIDHANGGEVYQRQVPPTRSGGGLRSLVQGDSVVGSRSSVIDPVITSAIFSPGPDVSGLLGGMEGTYSVIDLLVLFDSQETYGFSRLDAVVFQSFSGSYLIGLRAAIFDPGLTLAVPFSPASICFSGK
jgi:hypothetical protein